MPDVGRPSGVVLLPSATSAQRASASMARGNYNAAVIEITRLSDTGDTGLNVLDSDNPAAGFAAVADQNGVWRRVKAGRRFLVLGIQEYLTVELVDYLSGTWSVRATPIYAPSYLLPPFVLKRMARTSMADNTSVTLWAPATGKRFRLFGGIITSSVAGWVAFSDFNADGSVVDIDVAAGVPATFTLGPNGFRSGMEDGLLKVYNGTGATALVTATAWGYEE